MKVIYIAGPYRSPNAWAVEQNIRRAEDIAARVWAMGLVALCPHANSRHMEGVASADVFLAGTMELLRRCDAMVLVPGWGASSGTRAEVETASERGLPIFGCYYPTISNISYQDAEFDVLSQLESWRDDPEGEIA